MPLQSSGTIALSQVADEFRKTRDMVYLDRYRRNAGIVKTIDRNLNVPTNRPIGMSNLYGAAYYYFETIFQVSSESPSSYGNANNGSIRVYTWGATNNYFVTVIGRGTINISTNGGYATFGGFDAGTYIMSVGDTANSTSYSFTVNIGYGGVSTVKQGTKTFTLNTRHILG